MLYRTIFGNIEEVRFLETVIPNEYDVFIENVRKFDWNDDFEITLCFEDKKAIKNFKESYGYKSSRVGGKEVINGEVYWVTTLVKEI